VIETKEVHEPVNRQVNELRFERMRGRARLARRGLDGDDDVAEQLASDRAGHERAVLLRERQYVGRMIFARVLSIERAQRPVVAEPQRDLRLRAPRGGKRTLEHRLQAPRELSADPTPLARIDRDR
jgi:hypothetical protein